MIIRVITRTHGKVSMLAKNARRSQKRFGTQLDLFDRGVFTFKRARGSLFFLQDFTAAQSFKLIRENLAKITVASLICECFDCLIQEASDERIQAHELLNLALNAVDAASDAKEAFRASFFSLSNLLQITGFSSIDKSHKPSAKALLELIGKVEEIANRPVKTKSSMIPLIESLR